MKNILPYYIFYSSKLNLLYKNIKNNRQKRLYRSCLNFESILDSVGILQKLKDEKLKSLDMRFATKRPADALWSNSCSF